jgi:nicotinate-nucleotide pyrophosphorylase (carboxylating)
MMTEQTRQLIALALAEDIGHGDVTTLSTVPAPVQAAANIVARTSLVVSGMEIAGAVFHAVDPEITVEAFVEDGVFVEAGFVLATVHGPARGILTGERTALNFLQHLSGIATTTREYVQAVSGTGAQIVDTRKTVPGMRALAKAAVRHGGARNHRMGLDDGVLIKDNHIVAAGGISGAVRRARLAGGYLLRIEVECGSLGEVAEALKAGADGILLDNMDIVTLRTAADRCKGRAWTEASGGITLANVRQVAETGVDYISVGALTHSVRAVDIALDFIE